MKGTVFIVAGFSMKGSAKDTNLDYISGELKKRGYRVKRFSQTWPHQTHRSYVDKLHSYYRHNKGSRNIMIGNSFGALASLLLAVDVKPEQVILASLSPFFKESLESKKIFDYAVDKFGEKRTDYLMTRSIIEAANQANKTNTVFSFIYTDGDPVFLSDFSRKYQPLFKNSTIDKSENTKHSLSDRNYQDFILRTYFKNSPDWIDYK